MKGKSEWRTTLRITINRIDTAALSKNETLGVADQIVCRSSIWNDRTPPHLLYKIYFIHGSINRSFSVTHSEFKLIDLINVELYSVIILFKLLPIPLYGGDLRKALSNGLFLIRHQVLIILRPNNKVLHIINCHVDTSIKFKSEH